MAFSNKLKELREEHNITQAELAKALQLSRSCISMIEIGKNEPTASTLIAYANYFNLPIDELVEREAITAEERTAGAAETKKISISAIEEQMLDLFREIGVKHGKDAQIALITVAEKML